MLLCGTFGLPRGWAQLARPPRVRFDAEPKGQDRYSEAVLTSSRALCEEDWNSVAKTGAHSGCRDDICTYIRRLRNYFRYLRKEGGLVSDMHTDLWGKYLHTINTFLVSIGYYKAGRTIRR